MRTYSETLCTIAIDMNWNGASCGARYCQSRLSHSSADRDARRDQDDSPWRHSTLLCPSATETATVAGLSGWTHGSPGFLEASSPTKDGSQIQLRRARSYSQFTPKLRLRWKIRTCSTSHTSILRPTVTPSPTSSSGELG